MFIPFLDDIYIGIILQTFAQKQANREGYQSLSHKNVYMGVWLFQVDYTVCRGAEWFTHQGLRLMDLANLECG